MRRSARAIEEREGRSGSLAGVPEQVVAVPRIEILDDASQPPPLPLEPEHDVAARRALQGHQPFVHVLTLDAGIHGGRVAAEDRGQSARRRIRGNAPAAGLKLYQSTVVEPTNAVNWISCGMLSKYRLKLA